MTKDITLDLSHLQMLLSHVEEGVIICDRRDVVLYANIAAELILSLSREELIGIPLPSICEIKEMEPGISASSAKKGSPGKIGRLVRVHSSGAEQEIHVRIFSIDPVQELHIYILTPVGMLSMNLANDREKLKIIQASRMRALGELATGMAHELSQPLSIISLNVGLVQRRLSETTDPYVKEKLAQVVQQVQRASDFIMQLRQFTKGSSNTLERVGLNDVVKSSLSLLQHRMNRANITTELLLAEKLPSIEAKYSDIEQIILQCVLNAFEALESDTKKQKRIMIRTEKLENEVRVSIEDNGGGMPDYILQHIFTPFFSSKRNGEGMGLGLAVCQLLADEINSNMTISTSLGVGTIVRLHIPLSQCHDEAK